MFILIRNSFEHKSLTSRIIIKLQSTVFCQISSTHTQQRNELILECYVRTIGHTTSCRFNLNLIFARSLVCTEKPVTSSKAIEMAKRHGTRLHVLHISTADELRAIKEARKAHPGISAEVCVHYMWFDDNDYDRYGSLIKCNPSIKAPADREAITAAVREGTVQAVATDHAPHLFAEKMNDYLHAPSGLPTVQHSLVMMLQLAERGCFPITQVVRMMSHSPACLFRIDRRGYIREGYYADLVIVRRAPWTVSKANIAYRCGWSPLEGVTFDWAVTDTFVNGTRTVRGGHLTGRRNPSRLVFL